MSVDRFNWHHLGDEDAYLYHYTKASTLSIILRTGKLRFSRFENVNDPRESRDWRLSYRGHLPSNEKLAQLNHHLKRCWRIGCFVRDGYEAVTTRAREDRAEDVVGALYERGHSHPRMWSQYGQEYAGACLAFDRAKLDAAVRRSAGPVQIYCGEVEYRNPRVVPGLDRADALVIDFTQVKDFGIQRAMVSHVEQHHKELLFLKSKDWKEEREYRWVVKNDSPEDFFVPIEESLLGIILGDRFPSQEILSVSEFGGRHPISLARMEWNNGFPQPTPTHWRVLQDAIRPADRGPRALVDRLKRAICRLKQEPRL